MNKRIIWTLLAMCLAYASSTAQTPESNFSESDFNRGSSFEDVTKVELMNETGFQDERSNWKCRYRKNEDGSYGESCASTDYTLGSVIVPKWSVPYQVQFISNPKGESDALLRRTFPNLELWQARHICSGSLIHENWVLTAAHCIDKNIKPQGYGVRLKADSISEHLDDYIEVENYFIHKDYTKKPLENDVALIKLTEQVIPRKFEQYYSGLGSDKMAPWQAIMSKNGKRIITQPPDLETTDYFTVWDTLTGKRIYSHNKTDKITRAVNFDAEAGLVYGVDAFGAWVFDMQIDDQIRRISETDRTFRISYLQKIDQFATWSRDHKVAIWGRNNLDRIQSFQTNISFEDIDYLRPDSFRLYDRKGGESVFNSAVGTSLFIGEGMNYKLSPDGVHFVDIKNDTLNLRRTSDGQTLKSSPVDARSWSAWTEGEYLIVGGSQYIRIVNTNTLEDQLRVSSKSQQLLEVSGGKAFTMSDDNKFKAFKLGSSRAVGKVLLPEEYRKNGIWKVFDNGRKLLVSLPMGKSKVWKIKSGKLLYEINHSLPISHIYVSNDEKYLISYNEFGPTDIWSARNGKSVNRVFHRGVQGISFNGAKKRLVTWDHRGIARSWTLDSPEKLAEIDIKPLSPRIGKFPEIATIQLAKTEPKDGTQLWAYGWGKTREAAKLEPVSVLRGISFSKISDDVCRQKFNSARLELGDDEVCAFDEDRKTCKGDSGGPIATHDMLVGVTSWGARSCSEDNKQPSVMASVAYFHDWIKETVCDHPSSRQNPPDLCQN